MTTPPKNLCRYSPGSYSPRLAGGNRTILIAASMTVLLSLLLAFAFSHNTPAHAAAPATIRFAPIDIYLDTTHPLAAYQFELKTLTGTAAIVGIEGGEHPAFNAAPYYDPAALQHNRVIVGAFNTGADLPIGKTRIARIHMMITGDTTPQYQIIVQAAATTDGSPIHAIASIQEGTTP
jgi:hypothetical protein